MTTRSVMMSNLNSVLAIKRIQMFLLVHNNDYIHAKFATRVSKLNKEFWNISEFTLVRCLTIAMYVINLFAIKNVL